MTYSEESSKPFTKAEIKVILAAADRMVYVSRERERDPIFFGQLVRVFLTFGLHPSVLPRLTSDNLQRRPTDRGDRTYLVWQRPKQQALRHQVDFEVPKSMEPWLPSFLDRDKPSRVETYWDWFKRIEEEVRKGGYQIRVNARRFRHTAAVELIDRGFSQIDAEAALAVDPRTLKHYAVSTPEQRGEKGEKAGWGSW